MSRTIDAELLRQFITGKVDESEYLHRAGFVDRHAASTAGFELLESAAASLDPTSLQRALLLLHNFGLSREHVEALSSLAVQGWHISQEDLVSALAVIRDERAVAALYTVAMSPHLRRPYDTHDELGRKVTWALRKIESVSAVEALGRLAQADWILGREARARLEDVALRAHDVNLRHLARTLI